MEAPCDGERRLFSVRFRAVPDHILPCMILALDGERERGREIVLEHEVDDAIARYRMFEVKEEYSEDGNFDISQLRVLVEGEPVIRDENGERVQGQGSEA